MPNRRIYAFWNIAATTPYMRGPTLAPRGPVLQNDPEMGERLFQKVLDSSPDAWVKAWAHVYMGRLSDIAGNRDDAAKHYQTALALDGASATARRAAQQGMQESFKKQN